MKKLIAFLIAIALCACLLAGCSGAPEFDENISKSSSFVIVEDGHGYYIVYHKDTKVMYTLSSASYNMGNFYLLVNPDGTPMIWEGN
jgi:ABC-type Fe3+-hydroxamate transport system substrate-binding protein